MEISIYFPKIYVSFEEGLFSWSCDQMWSSTGLCHKSISIHTKTEINIICAELLVFMTVYMCIVDAVDCAERDYV